MKVLVVDDHPLVRDALRTCLRGLGTGVEVLEARNGAEAMEQTDRNPELDMVLLDLSLPDTRGCSALVALRERHPEVPVVVLSANEDRTVVLEALDHGAMGYIPKTSTTEVMLSALHLVLAGGVYLPANVLTKNPSEMAAPLDPPEVNTSVGAPANIGLTERQAQILMLLVQGKPNKLISRELRLAESTVKVHISAILKALHVVNRTQAVIAVGRLGLKLDGASRAAKPR